MATLEDLANRMIALAGTGAGSVSDKANSASIFVATQIVVELVRATPVDTSRALSNWQVSLGSGALASLPAHIPGFSGSTRAASIELTIAAAVRILREKRPGQPIHIVNNLPYIRRLNDGSSSQAPAGFVERAELIGRKAAENVKF